MLVLISDLHLGDGTTAASIPASAFYLFAKRLRQDAHFAARKNGHYRPIEELDVLLVGDVLDPLHSTKWFYPVGKSDSTEITKPGDPEYIRPWSDPADPKFAAKLLEVTRAIFKENEEALDVMRKLASGETIQFDPSIDENRSTAQEKIPLKVRFHYMVGNHDWYYHLKGEAFDAIRQEIITALSLSNPPTPFPHDLRKFNPDSPWQADEAPAIQRLFDEYKVFARHGDTFDSFNFDAEKGRDFPTLGDAFTVEVCNRYPEELKRLEGIDTHIVDKLRLLTNVRPAFATPLWLSGQVRSLVMNNMLNDLNEVKLKQVWDDLADEFLQIDFVRNMDKAFTLDTVDKLQLAIKASKLVSFETVDALILRFSGSGQDRSFANQALQEPAFLDRSARYIVYGHTHHHETVPLDFDYVLGKQIYFNSGTWYTYFDLARKNPIEKKFVPYKALTYITFYKPEEHDERDFETWSGAYA